MTFGLLGVLLSIGMAVALAEIIATSRLPFTKLTRMLDTSKLLHWRRVRHRSALCVSVMWEAKT
jgi:energy-converting hydrogenase Eha subunit G